MNAHSAVDAGGFPAIAGGVHATAEPQQVIDAGWDLAAIGEGEPTIVALVEALRADRPLTAVPGLAVRDGDGRALRTPPAPQLPLDAFPSFPDRRRHFGPIEITRGCAYTCRFCQCSSCACSAVSATGTGTAAAIVRPRLVIM
ncbi:hypothetical protein AB0B54_00815 [Microbispora bryophytorum]|uniref:hypothetical protein n=1 Tax=Microbispora bryophytorum TaxID=1460882 RepID=UPI0033CE0E6F